MTQERAAYIRASGERQIRRMRSKGYAELRQLIGTAQHDELALNDGMVLIRETQVLWDHKPGGSIRVIVDVFDVTRGESETTSRELWYGDFIMNSDGAFEGE